MHKIHTKEFTLEDFSCEHLEDLIDCDGSLLIDVSPYKDDSNLYSPMGILTIICKALNRYRERYLETKEKKYWWQMIQLLPSSYNQKRTIKLNYEVLANMYKSRNNHKLDEWHTFCDWIESLPYSEIITGRETEEESDDLSQILIKNAEEYMENMNLELDEDYEYVIGIYYPSSYQRLARFVERLRYDLFLSGIDTNIIDNNKTLVTDKGKIIFVRDPRFIAGTRYSKYFEFPDDMKDEFVFRESDEKPFDGTYKDYILMKEGINDEEG